MAVRINVEAFVEAIDPEVVKAASELLSTECVGELAEAGGGVQAVVHDGSDTRWPWVGIVDGAFAGECECREDDELCVHAVAVALAAFEEDVRWSGAAVPPSVESASERARYATAVERLAPGQLAALVVDQAAEDELFATALLRAAGMLEAADHEDGAEPRGM